MSSLFHHSPFDDRKFQKQQLPLLIQHKVNLNYFIVLEIYSTSYHAIMIHQSFLSFTMSRETRELNFILSLSQVIEMMQILPNISLPTKTAPPALRANLPAKTASDPPPRASLPAKTAPPTPPILRPLPNRPPN